MCVGWLHSKNPALVVSCATRTFDQAHVMLIYPYLPRSGPNSAWFNLHMGAHHAQAHLRSHSACKTGLTIVRTA